MGEGERGREEERERERAREGKRECAGLETGFFTSIKGWKELFSSKNPVSESRSAQILFEITNYQLPLPITHSPLPITNYPLPITHYPLPITHYPLPITNYPLPITNYQLPIKFSS